ncbi:MAG: hypothetical protein QOJ79_3617 [Actinomycetota bacterium]|jgi:hypothetical protein|nr:hypothetical protein [Actinomycetota bacterium]
MMLLLVLAAPVRLYLPLGPALLMNSALLTVGVLLYRRAQRRRADQSRV